MFKSYKPSKNYQNHKLIYVMLLQAKYYSTVRENITSRGNYLNLITIKPDADNESIYCYDVIDKTIESTRQVLKFWVEGVVSFIIGCLGLAGNMVTILVLRRCRKNRNFNILIIW